MVKLFILESGIMVPARSSIFIPLRCMDAPPDMPYVYMEPRRREMDKLRLYVPRHLLRVYADVIVVKVMNPTLTKHEIPAGTRIATTEYRSDVDILEEVSQGRRRVWSWRFSGPI
jgi:hypothetical protein